MNGFRALFVHALRERLASPNRLLLGGAFALVPVVSALFSAGGGSLPAMGVTPYLCLVFGSGLIGPDAASGVLQLVMARPVTRAAYVVARWLSAVALAGGLSVLLLAVATLIMTVKGNRPPAVEVAANAGLEVSMAIGLTAVLTALSAIASGYGDLRIWVLTWILGEVVGWVGQLRGQAWLARLGNELDRLMFPSLQVDQLADLTAFPWEPGIAWLSTVALAIAVAIVVMNRKELSYGSA